MQSIAEKALAFSASTAERETAEDAGLCSVLQADLYHRAMPASTVYSRLSRLLAVGVLASSAVLASDELTVYELLAPDTHAFAIVYDMSTAVEGSPYLFNPIRRGSVATEERVIDAATGRALSFRVVSAADAQAHGLRGKPNAEEYIEVTLAHPVPRHGESRVRIFKTYTDAASYAPEGSDLLVFQRSFGIKRNVIILPRGYELINCGAPGIVSLQADGRVRVSFVNDRDDELMVSCGAGSYHDHPLSPFLFSADSGAPARPGRKPTPRRTRP